MSTRRPPTAVTHSERLVPSPGVWAAVLLLGAIALVASLPLGPVVGIAAAAAVVVGTGLALVLNAPVVRVDAEGLRAGRAWIGREHLGAVIALEGEDARQARGPGLDARAYLCLRGWVPDLVRVEVVDPADPTPYWLVSTRRPQALAAALQG